MLGKWLCRHGWHRIIYLREITRPNLGPLRILAVSCARKQCQYRREIPRPTMPARQGEAPCAD